MPARGALDGRLQQLVAAARSQSVTGFSIEAVMADDDGVMLTGNSARGQRQVGAFDRLSLRPARPIFTLTRELRLDLDPGWRYTCPGTADRSQSAFLRRRPAPRSRKYRIRNRISTRQSLCAHDSLSVDDPAGDRGRIGRLVLASRADRM